jgi:hypothetical protein
VEETEHVVRTGLGLPEAETRQFIKKASKFWEPEVDPRTAKGYVGQAARAGSEMGTLALTGPAALPMLAARAGSEKAAEALDEGTSMPRALAAGAVTAAGEYLTERIPFGVITGKYGKGFLNRLALGLVTDPAGEAIATANEMLVADPILGKKYTKEQLAQAMIDSAIVGGIMTGSGIVVTQPFVGDQSQDLTTSEKDVSTQQKDYAAKAEALDRKQQGLQVPQETAPQIDERQMALPGMEQAGIETGVEGPMEKVSPTPPQGPVAEPVVEEQPAVDPRQAQLPLQAVKKEEAPIETFVNKDKEPMVEVIDAKDEGEFKIKFPFKHRKLWQEASRLVGNIKEGIKTPIDKVLEPYTGVIDTAINAVDTALAEADPKLPIKERQARATQAVRDSIEKGYLVLPKNAIGPQGGEIGLLTHVMGTLGKTFERQSQVPTEAEALTMETKKPVEKTPVTEEKPIETKPKKPVVKKEVAPKPEVVKVPVKTKAKGELMKELAILEKDIEKGKYKDKEKEAKKAEVEALLKQLQAPTKKAEAKKPTPKKVKPTKKTEPKVEKKKDTKKKESKPNPVKEIFETSKDAGEAIDKLTKVTKNKVLKAILTRIAPHVDPKGKVGVSDTKGLATYSNLTGEIKLSPKLFKDYVGMEEHAAVHELLHAAVNNVLARSKTAANLRKMPKNVQVAIRDLNKLHKDVMAIFKKQGGRQAEEWLRVMEDKPQEFVTYGMTSPTFQAALKDMKIGKQTAMTKFAKALKKMLGLPAKASALEDVIVLSEKLLEGSETQPTKATKPRGKQEGNTQQFTKKPKLGSFEDVSEMAAPLRTLQSEIEARTKKAVKMKKDKRLTPSQWQKHLQHTATLKQMKDNVVGEWPEDVYGEFSVVEVKPEKGKNKFWVMSADKVSLMKQFDSLLGASKWLNDYYEHKADNYKLVKEAQAKAKDKKTFSVASKKFPGFDKSESVDVTEQLPPEDFDLPRMGRSEKNNRPVSKIWVPFKLGKIDYTKDSPLQFSLVEDKGSRYLVWTGSKTVEDKFRAAFQTIKGTRFKTDKEAYAQADVLLRSIAELHANKKVKTGDIKAEDILIFRRGPRSWYARLKNIFGGKSLTAPIYAIHARYNKRTRDIQYYATKRQLGEPGRIAPVGNYDKNGNFIFVNKLQDVKGWLADRANQVGEWGEAITSIAVDDLNKQFKRTVQAGKKALPQKEAEEKLIDTEQKKELGQLVRKIQDKVKTLKTITKVGKKAELASEKLRYAQGELAQQKMLLGVVNDMYEEAKERDDSRNLESSKKERKRLKEEVATWEETIKNLEDVAKLTKKKAEKDMNTPENQEVIQLEETLRAIDQAKAQDDYQSALELARTVTGIKVQKLAPEAPELESVTKKDLQRKYKEKEEDISKMEEPLILEDPDVDTKVAEALEKRAENPDEFNNLTKSSRFHKIFGPLMQYYWRAQEFKAIRRKKGLSLEEGFHKIYALGHRFRGAATQAIRKEMKDLKDFFDREIDKNTKHFNKLNEVIWVLDAMRSRPTELPTKFETTKDESGATVLEEPTNEYYNAVKEYIKKNFDGITDAVLNDYIEIRKVLDKNMVDLYNDVHVLAAEQGNNSTRQIKELIDQMGNIEFYFPHMRFGDYFVEVKHKGETVYRTQIDKETLANKAKKMFGTKDIKTLSDSQKADLLNLFNEIPELSEANINDFTFDSGKVEDENLYDMHANPMPLEMMHQVMETTLGNLKGKHANADFYKAIEKEFGNVAKAKTRAKGFFTQRKNIAGHATGPNDLKKVLLSYVTSMNSARANLKASQAFSTELAKVDWRSNPEEYRVADGYMSKYFSRANKFTSKAKQLLFLKYLGFNASTIALNLTQPFVTALPRLASDTGLKDSASIKLAKGYMDNVKDLAAYTTKGERTLNEEQKDLIKVLMELGEGADQFVQQMIGQVNVEAAVGDKWADFIRKSGAWMGHAERLNRGSVALAAYQMARDGMIKNPDVTMQYKVPPRMVNGKTIDTLQPGDKFSHEQAVEYARGVVSFTQFDYGRDNIPEMFSKMPLGELMYVFQSFPLNMSYALAHYARHGGARGAAAIAMTSLAMMAFGGEEGLPFFDTIFNPAMKMIAGDDWKVKQRELLEEMTDKKWADVVTKGLPTLAGIDLSSRMGVNPYSPYVRDDVSTEEWFKALLFGFSGPAGSLVSDVLKAYDLQKEYGSSIKAAEKVVPNTVANVMRGYLGWKYGVKSSKGDPLKKAGTNEEFKYTGVEGLFKALGLPVARETNIYDYNNVLYELQRRGYDKSDWLVYQVINDHMTYQDAMNKIKAWNRAYPESAINVKRTALRMKGKKRISRGTRRAAKAIGDLY